LCRDVDDCPRGAGAAYAKAKHDPVFQTELRLYPEGVRRPADAALFRRRLTQHCGGAKIYFKREDLLHTGAHKINNAWPGAARAPHGKKRVIARPGRPARRGDGQRQRQVRPGMRRLHGTVDMERQALNVFRMRLMGAEVRGVEAGRNPQGGDQRGHARLGDQCAHDHYILGTRTARIPIR